MIKIVIIILLISMFSCSIMLKNGSTDNGHYFVESKMKAIMRLDELILLNNVGTTDSSFLKTEFNRIFTKEQSILYDNCYKMNIDFKNFTYVYHYIESESNYAVESLVFEKDGLCNAYIHELSSRDTVISITSCKYYTNREYQIEVPIWTAGFLLFADYNENMTLQNIDIFLSVDPNIELGNYYPHD